MNNEKYTLSTHEYPREKQSCGTCHFFSTYNAKPALARDQPGYCHRYPTIDEKSIGGVRLLADHWCGEWAGVKSILIKKRMVE